MKSCADKQKLRNLTSTKPALERVLKGRLQAGSTSLRCSRPSFASIGKDVV